MGKALTMNCEGSSTASQSTWLIPATGPVFSVVNMCCSACPNSWKRVVTSLCVISDGFLPTGGVPLHTMCAVGNRTNSPGAAMALDRPTTSSIHAPPLFSAGRVYGSR